MVHLVRFLLPADMDDWVLETFSFIPARFADTGYSGDPVSLILMPLSHLFLHADWMHLIVNMAFLLAFGSVIGRRMGAVQFLLLYALCGVAAAFFWALLYPGNDAILLGASGAISGMVGAAARVSIWPPHRNGSALPFWRRSTVVTFVVIWMVLNFAFGVFPIFLSDAYGGIAWQAHLGGFIAGFLLIGVFDGRGRLQPIAPPFEIR